MEIYLDLIWLLNFIFDLTLIFLTKAILLDHTKTIRNIFGALVASFIVPLSLYHPNSFFTTVLGKFLYSVLIILSAFKFLGVYRFLKTLMVFYFLSFAIGGGLFAIHFMFQQPFAMTADGIITLNHGYGDPISWLFVVIFFPVVWIFTKKRLDQNKMDGYRLDHIYHVTITIKGIDYRTLGYLDSGNQLTDPITKYPVIICDEVFLEKVFHEEELMSFKRMAKNLDFNDPPKTWESYLHLIPYQGVQGFQSFLLALRPDQVLIQWNDREIKIEKVLIGMQFGVMTKDQSYHCLLHPMFIQLFSNASA